MKLKAVFLQKVSLFKAEENLLSLKHFTTKTIYQFRNMTIYFKTINMIKIPTRGQ